jgi:hypothetical protein
LVLDSGLLEPPLCWASGDKVGPSNIYFMKIGAVFDLNQIAGLGRKLHLLTLLLISSHPSGQEGSYGHSIV